MQPIIQNLEKIIANYNRRLRFIVAQYEVAADNCNHLLHHLHQILDLDPIAYP